MNYVASTPKYSDDLQHYGVMGMHWGVRKDGKPQGYQSGKRRKTSSLSETSSQSTSASSHKTTRKNTDSSASSTKKLERQEAKQIRKQRKKDVNRKNLSRMSDKDLDAKIERLSKEKKLRELTESEVTPGKKFVKDVIGTSGRKVAVGLATAGIGALAANKLGGEISKGQAARDAYKMTVKTK